VNKAGILAMGKKERREIAAEKTAWRDLLVKNFCHEDALEDEFKRAGICYVRDVTMFFNDGLLIFPDLSSFPVRTCLLL